MMTRRSASTAAPADPCCFVVFGACGDLAHRLLVPALYNLAVRGLLPEAFAIIGVARAEKSAEAFRTELENGLSQFAIGTIDREVARRLFSCVGYVSGDVADPATYRKLDETLEHLERARDTRGNRLFYLATPPSAFAPIGCRLGNTGLTRQGNGTWRRIIVE